MWKTIFMLLLCAVPLSAGQAKNIYTIDAYNFKFTIDLPSGWKAVPQKIKDDYVLYMLYSTKSSPMKPGAVITIQTFAKNGMDMQEYVMGQAYNIAQQKKNLDIEEFEFFHPVYDSFSITYSMDGITSSILTAIDPGVTVRKGIIVFITLPGREITPEEMDIFMKLVESVDVPVLK
ncbi:MAG: hypothetical protein A2Y33_10630 [Spirochaetes bacterium GWF1_51_8]|nr:MAG: hypothetical protein A2Y33_10630 [Spirochaetes bacterium GWF1_51_8]